MMKLVVLSCLVAAACGSAIITPYAAPFAAAPYAYTAAPYFGYSAYAYPGYNYRGPLSLAPGQPASILGADGRPLDTLDVNLDKSAHLTAKAFAGSGVHLLKKRSAALYNLPITTPIVAPVSAYPYAATAYAAPYAYSPYTAYGGYGYTGYGAPLAYLK